MNKLFDYIKYSGIPYYELENSDEKHKVEKFVSKLDGMGFSKTILTHPLDYQFDIREMEGEQPNFVSGFAPDLTQSMRSIWIHLQD
jgi:hypothetical protein